MATNVKSSFENTKVELDGNTFDECKFKDCKIVYAASGPYRLANCTFDDCRWELAGAAADTVRYLKAIYHGGGDGGRQLIEQTFAGIRQG